MSDKTVKQLAEMVGIPLERLLEQLTEAGLNATSPDDVVNEAEKTKLLTHLRERHGKANKSGAGNSPTRVTLKSRKVSELKQASVPGNSTKTISVAVRKKKTYIKRDGSVENPKPKKAVIPAKSRVAAVNRPAMKKPTGFKNNVVQEKVVASGSKAVIADKVKQPEIVDTKLEKEKKARLEASVERNAEKVRRLAAAKQQQKNNKSSTPNRAAKAPVKKEDNKPKVFTGRAAAPASNGRRSKNKKVKQKGRKAQATLVVETKHQFEKPVIPEIKNINVPENIIVSDLAQRMSVKVAEVVKQLMQLGMMATINQSIDQETAVLLIEEMGHKAVMQSDADLEEEMLSQLRESDEERKFLPRAPIVTIMGHVDHGKTSLLDYIRKTRVASGEAGGITQHIGAYQVKTDHGDVTFLDTPGHAAFTAMRARGAEITDVVIIVVAADDGVMPQTKEAVEHARAANVPIIIAINKIDRDNANPEKVMQELATINVVPEEWGGDVLFLKISAKTGAGINELIEALILQTEILELTAPPTGRASGLVIESRLDKGRGVVATVLVQRGTLFKGDMVLCGNEYGRVRALFNENSKVIKDAGPGVPVEIVGLSGTPKAGDEFLVVQNEKVARELAEHRSDKNKLNLHAAQQVSKLDDVFAKMSTGETASLNLVLKTDVQGSLEALRESLIKLSNDEVEVKCVYGGVGGINESDVHLASASDAVLMGFNVRADATARKLIEEKGIDLHYYSVIYDAIDEVKRSIGGMLTPDIHEKIMGLAEVRDVFRSPKFGSIAGCMVIDGIVKRNLDIRVLRENVVIYEGQLESLRRFKDDAMEVKMGMECGIGVKNYNDVKVGDQIEVFERFEVARVV